MPGDMMTIDESGILKQAELMALREMSNTMKRISDELVSQRDKHEVVVQTLSDIRTDIAVMQEANKAVAEIKADVANLDLRMKVIEARNQQIDGATNFVKWLREFGPWLFSMLVMAWALFSKK